MTKLPLSLLEILTNEKGRLPAEVISGTVRVAQRADELGFSRVWYAEHHATPALLDVPPSIAIAHVAAVTSSIRVGSGGVLAPNHAPLALAEQFAALSSFHPGRIDLGIGRGPGTMNAEVAQALRWGAPPADESEYHERVATLLGLVGERHDLPEPWLLGSSVAGAALAAEFGLPLAFAHHLKPENTAEAVERYRDSFRPSRWRDTPQVLLSVSAICADTEEEARRLGRPIDIAAIRVLTGRSAEPLLSPEAAAEHLITAEEQEMLEARSVRVQGTPQQVERQLDEVGERFGADELMLSIQVHDAASRIRSLEGVAGAVAAGRVG